MEKGQVTKIRINPLLLIWSFFVGWNMCKNGSTIVIYDDRWY